MRATSSNGPERRSWPFLTRTLCSCGPCLKAKRTPRTSSPRAARARWMVSTTLSTGFARADRLRSDTALKALGSPTLTSPPSPTIPTAGRPPLRRSRPAEPPRLAPRSCCTSTIWPSKPTCGPSTCLASSSRRWTFWLTCGPIPSRRPTWAYSTRPSTTTWSRRMAERVRPTPSSTNGSTFPAATLSRSRAIGCRFSFTWPPTLKPRTTKRGRGCSTRATSHPIFSTATRRSSSSLRTTCGPSRTTGKPSRMLGSFATSRPLSIGSRSSTRASFVRVALKSATSCGSFSPRRRIRIAIRARGSTVQQTSGATLSPRSRGSRATGAMNSMVRPTDPSFCLAFPIRVSRRAARRADGAIPC
mmetsp:Transcript_26427/g.84042  ORF Transcript_26427/g.84042 Transcript_26427/m.84042 type:complete len:359 (+) Transcript_26427:798-1874(+)